MKKNKELELQKLNQINIEQNNDFKKVNYKHLDPVNLLENKSIDINIYENKYFQLFNELTDSLVVLEITSYDILNFNNLIFKDVNPAFEKFVKLKKNEIITKNIHEIIPDINKKLIKKFITVARNRKSLQFEYYSNSRKTYCDIKVFSLKKHHIAVLFKDITKKVNQETLLKENEQQLSIIFDNSPSIMLLVDSARKIVRVNKIAQKFAKKTERESINRSSGDILNCLYSFDS